MSKLLVPINDSNDIECALKHVIERHRTQPGTLFLLNVQTPISKFITRFVSRKQVEEFHQENGMQILQPMIDGLDAAGVPHQERVVVGHKAESIVQFAREHHCDQIVVPKHKSVFENLGLGSVGSQLRQLIGAEGICDISEVY
ncbi:universal stress protein [Herminiimonas sp. NPDC097707]|uniref:Universal stress protein UspA n=1 Tax=Herminiimonas arsenicoxydans TaxID=204773 RepID=A4G8H1_HERAR|nr:Putative universal stress protein UspA [Herminiimonas arsenicoxydans]